MFLFQANTQNSWPVGGHDCSTRQPVTSSPAHQRDQAFITAAVGEIEKWHVELVGINFFCRVIPLQNLLVLCCCCSSDD